jgi:methionyl-tRNA formyltransferase
MVSAAPQRIIYFGTPEFAVPALQVLLSSRHQVVALLSQPDRPKGRGQRLQSTPTKRVAEAAGIPVLQPTRLKDPELHTTLAALKPDLGVVAAYGRLIPDAMLEIPRLGMINIHASLLPRYRGAAPVHRAVMDGEAETGVTIMRVVTELDAGPMLATATRPIGPAETTPEVEAALATLGAELVLDVIEQMAAGSATEVAQNHGEATHAEKIRREESDVDWTQPAQTLHNLVRGLQPWPLVSITLDGVRLRIHKSTVADERTAAPPGRVVHADGGRLSIATGGGGVLDVQQIQPEGKRVMSAREFLAGRHVTLGAPVSTAASSSPE